MYEKGFHKRFLLHSYPLVCYLNVNVILTCHNKYYNPFARGCYFQEGNEVKMNMSLETAFRKSIKTVFDWIYNEVNMSKTYVLFRTYAPIHFRFCFASHLIVIDISHLYKCKYLNTLRLHGGGLM